MKETVRQNLKIALLAILFLVAAVFSILALIPEHTDVEVREAFTVSSSRLSGNNTDRYLLEVIGKLRNTTSKPILVDNISVRVPGVSVPIESAEPLLIGPRAEEDVILRMETEVDASAVTAVSVSVGGEQTTLRNPAVTDTFGYAFLPLLLTLLFLLLTAHAVTIRIYMQQEKTIIEKEG